MSPRLARALLLAGLLGGGALAALPVIERVQDGALPDGVVARVGDRLILRDEWLRAVAAVASERRTPLDEADRLAILDRLVDEALLVQHGRALDLVARDPRLRGQLVGAVMQLTMDAQDATVDEATLRTYHADNAAAFQSAPRLRLRITADAPSGGPPSPHPAMPSEALPPSQWRQHLGPTLLTAVMALAPGQSLQGADAAGAPLKVTLLARDESSPPPFEVVREAVHLAWRREQDEAAVRALLRSLRQQYPVTLAP
jgi:hypothetical protein